MLDHYVQQGVGELDDNKLPQLLRLRYDAVSELGSVGGIRELFIGFQRHLYEKSLAA